MTSGATPKQILFNANWLLKHSEYWEDASTKARATQSQAASVRLDEAAWTWDLISGLHDAYDNFTKSVNEALGEATECTRDTSELLHSTAIQYINTEAANEQISQDILKQLGQ